MRTYLDLVASLFRPQLPSLQFDPKYEPGSAGALATRRVVWPRVPVVLVSGAVLRRDEGPAMPWTIGPRVFGRDQYYYAIQPIAALLHLAAWWDHRRWCVEDLLVRWGILLEPSEACYYHELRLTRAPICWLVGHRPESDPARSFSYRLKVCTRCHRVTR